MNRQIRVADGMLSVEDEGHANAPAVVLLHGMVASSFSWRILAPELAASFRVLKIDAVAHGESRSDPDCDFCLQGHAMRVLQVLDELGIDSCSYVASSYGGAVAMQAAVLAPQRARRLVLAAPAHPFVRRPIFVARVYSTILGRAVARTYPYVPAPVFRWAMARMFGDGTRCALSVAREYQRSIKGKGNISGMLQTVRSYGHDMQLLSRELPSIQDVPVRLIWGDRDPMVALISADSLMREFRDVRLRVLSGVGHLPYEEAPQQFAQAVNESLAD